MFFIPSVSMPNIVCVVPNSMMKFYLQIALTKNSWQRFFCYCSVKQMPWPFCQANSVAGNMCSGRKNRKFTNISIITIINAAQWTVFFRLMLFMFFWKVMIWILLFNLLFYSYKIIFRETSYITVFGTFSQYWEQKVK